MMLKPECSEFLEACVLSTSTRGTAPSSRGQDIVPTIEQVVVFFTNSSVTLQYQVVMTCGLGQCRNVVIRRLSAVQFDNESFHSVTEPVMLNKVRHYSSELVGEG
jgi:hypothetical protein